MVANGAFTVSLTVTNSVGNQTTSTAPKLVYVDTVAPTPSLTVITNTAGSFNLTWSASDPATVPGQTNPPVQEFEVQVGQAVTATIAWQGWLTATNQSSADYSGKVGYSYYFRVKARDRAGNQNAAWVQAGPYSISRLATKYYLFGSQRVAMRQGNVVYYLHSDHLGSTSLTTDANGAVVSQARYLPYGEIRWGGAGPTDFGFTGQRNDSFGLMDYNARFYSPFLGRFVSPDTLVPGGENPQAWNRYTYTYNNPLNYNDQSGHCPAPSKDSGQVVCVDLFIKPETFAFGFAHGDGREHSPNSEINESRGFLYLYLNDAGNVDRATVHSETSCIAIGCFGPYQEYNVFNVTQNLETGDITIEYSLLNGASGFLKTLGKQFAEENGKLIPALGPGLEAISFTLAEINGTVTINCKNGCKLVNENRDPYPSLSIYTYNNGEYSSTVIEEDQWPSGSVSGELGPFIGLNPLAPNQGGLFDFLLPEPKYVKQNE